MRLAPWLLLLAVTAACASRPAVPSAFSGDIPWWLVDLEVKPAGYLNGFGPGTDRSLQDCFIPAPGAPVPEGKLICYVTSFEGFIKLQGLISSLSGRLKACEKRSP